MTREDTLGLAILVRLTKLDSLGETPGIDRSVFKKRESYKRESYKRESYKRESYKRESYLSSRNLGQVEKNSANQDTST